MPINPFPPILRTILFTCALVCFISHFCYASEYPEIHCKHFIHGYPTGAPFSNDLIIRDAYALSSNDDTKFADWVAYRIDKKTVMGTAKTTRKWASDPWLDEQETLEPSDYTGAHAALNVDRGHQAPLASVVVPYFPVPQVKNGYIDLIPFPSNG